MRHIQKPAKIYKLSAGALLALMPAYSLQAYTTGNGTIGTPYVIDASDAMIDGGSALTPAYYEAGTSVDFNSSNVYIGYSNLNNFLTITGNATTVSDASGYIGYNTGSAGTVTVTGSGSKWSNSGEIDVGYYGTGTLNIQNGATVSNTDGYIGACTDSTGAVTVTGSGSTWTNSSNLYVGNAGAGTLNIEDGGIVSNVEGYIGYVGTGAVTVTGPDSKWTSSGDLYVGDYNTGTLNIEDGGTVSNTNGRLGYGTGGTGKVTVTGTGSKWTNSNILYVGDYNTGTLAIENHGTVSNTDGYIGYGTGITGTATVTGSGSKWTNTGYLYVGYDGAGTLNIENGGTVSNDYGYIGEDTGSTGAVTVTGSGSMWINSGDLYVGDSGTGTLNINNGALVTVGGALSTGLTGIIKLSGGYLAIKSVSQLDAATVASGYNIEVLLNGTWTAATADNLNVTNYDASNFIAGDALYDTYYGKGIDLGGYAVITSAVPEPATFAIIGGLGTLGYVFIRRRRTTALQAR